MGVLFLLVNVIINVACIITVVSSVEICSNETEHGRQISLYKRYGSGASCGCSVNLVNGNENTTVIFQPNQQPQGCQYKLIFNWNSNTTEYDCKKHNATYEFTMTQTDQLYVYLMNDRNDTSNFVFNFTIQTNGPPVELTCRSPWTNPQEINQTSLTTVGGSSIQYDSTGTSGQTKSTGTTDRSPITEKPKNSDLPVIVGSAVGGVVLVSVIVIIVICFLKRRKKKGQANQNVSDQNIPDSNAETVPNDSSQTEHQNTVDATPNNAYSNLGPRDNHTKYLSYEQFPKQEQHVTEQQVYVQGQYENVPKKHERVLHKSHEYVNAPEKQMEGSTPDNGIELNVMPNNVYSSLEQRYNNSNDLTSYEQFPKQEEHVLEQHKHIPHTDNEYANVAKKDF